MDERGRRDAPTTAGTIAASSHVPEREREGLSFVLDQTRTRAAPRAEHAGDLDAELLRDLRRARAKDGGGGARARANTPREPANQRARRAARGDGESARESGTGRKRTPSLPGVARARRLEPEQDQRIVLCAADVSDAADECTDVVAGGTARGRRALAKGGSAHISARARAPRRALSLVARARRRRGLREEGAEPPRRRAARVLRERVRHRCAASESTSGT